MSDWLWPLVGVVCFALFWWLSRPRRPDTIDRFKQWRP